MEWNEYEKKFNEKANHVTEWLADEFAKIRTGRVTANAIDHIKVEAYGELQPIKNIANISSPEPRVLVIKAYDPSTYKDIMAAINASNLGINPQLDADKIRLAFPALTEDSRKELAKKAKEVSEEAKIKIRKIRQTIQDEYRKETLSDDDKKYYNEQLDKVTKSYNEKIEKLLETKTKEILTI